VADVSVRSAQPGDVGEIARIQIETWRVGYQEILPEPVLAGLSVETAQEAWTGAITAPPSPQHHVLVAVEGQWLVGFVAFGPAEPTSPEEPEPERTVAIGPLLVEPRWGRRGHGSRLLAAAIDIARADGMVRALAWVPGGDGPSLALYRSAGWETDGFARTLDTGAGEVRELRLHTSLAD
jgi:GNAT superfamily N-acetyltransferase